MLRMVMIVYNEAIDMEVMEILTDCQAENYTKITAAFGKGKSSGTHLGNDIWPGRNNIMYVSCEEKKAKAIIDKVIELRRKLGPEGVKAFSWMLEEIT